MTHSLISQKYPFANAHLLSDYEAIMRGITRYNIDNTTLDEVLPNILKHADRAKHYAGQLKRTYESSIRLCVIDYRRSVELARKMHQDPDKRKPLIKVHTNTYRVACEYADRRYADNLGLYTSLRIEVGCFKDQVKDPEDA